MNEFQTIDEAMTAGAAHAVDISIQQRIALDYSWDSLQVVEHQLAELHDAIPKGFFAKLRHKGPTDAEIHMMAMSFGAYIGEVFKRRFGGHWSEENSLDPTTKIPTLHLANNGGEIWPQLKAEKRLRNGSEDSVWHYAQVLVKTLEQEAS